MCDLAPGCLTRSQTPNHHSLATQKPTGHFLTSVHAEQQGGGLQGARRSRLWAGWTHIGTDTWTHLGRPSPQPVREALLFLQQSPERARQEPEVTKPCRNTPSRDHGCRLRVSRREPGLPGPVLPTKTLSFPRTLSKQYKQYNPTTLGWVIRVRP